MWAKRRLTRVLGQRGLRRSIEPCTYLRRHSASYDKATGALEHLAARIAIKATRGPRIPRVISSDLSSHSLMTSDGWQQVAIATHTSNPGGAAVRRAIALANHPN
jgi:hypothetical protein